VSSVRTPGTQLWRAVDRLASRLERKALPDSAREITNADLSDAEALTLGLFGESRVGDGADERQEKIALARVLACGKGVRRGKRRTWGAAIEQSVPSYRGPLWQIGAAINFQNPSLLPTELRTQLQRDGTRLRRHFAQASEITGLALSDALPVNTPRADHFASDTEIATVKARGLVAPGTLVHYGEHWFYSAPGRTKSAAPRTPRTRKAGSSGVSRRAAGRNVQGRSRTTGVRGALTGRNLTRDTSRVVEGGT
jgi:hypothetical protein